MSNVHEVIENGARGEGGEGGRRRTAANEKWDNIIHSSYFDFLPRVRKLRLFGSSRLLSSEWGIVCDLSPAGEDRSSVPDTCFNSLIHAPISS